MSDPLLTLFQIGKLSLKKPNSKHASCTGSCRRRYAKRDQYAALEPFDRFAEGFF